MYCTNKPTTIIPTNGSFILDEMYDMRVTQIGGTESFCSSTGSVSERINSGTYLYIKCQDYTTEQIKYAKIRLRPEEKCIIDDGMSTSLSDKDGNLLFKSLDCHLRICSTSVPYTNPFMASSITEFLSIEFIQLGYFWKKDQGVTQYPYTILIEDYFKTSWDIEFVDQPQPHAMQFSYIEE